MPTEVKPTTADTQNAMTRVRGCCMELAPALPAATADQLAAIFKALSDPTRVQMLHLLKSSSEPICVCDFTAAFDVGQPTVSHHLAKLREAGLVDSFKRGVWAFYYLRDTMPVEARTALELIG
jgi:ArsR family transcriptional regulator, arsenate/arsenite/antimonite-responsive transcriptional repressor